MNTCADEPYTDCMCSCTAFICCSVGSLEGERGACGGDCCRSVRTGVRGEGRDCCTGDRKKESWKPGWGWLCCCATCINCCCGCPMLVILTVLSSCWKDVIWSRTGSGCSSGTSIVVARLRPRKSRLMPDRCGRCCRMLAGSGRTVGASKAAGVEFCRRCCVLRR